MLKQISALLLAIAATCSASASAQAGMGPESTIERNVPMQTRDGVTLRADIYRPGKDGIAAEGQFPVLLQRTPYNKDGGNDFGRRAAARGFMVVIQDVRGRYNSDGDWYTFKHESEDGYDAVEWAATLPHSNGKVGMWGGSYVGATQMLAAIAHPPHLAGICPVVTASNYHENWTYQGGALEQWFDQSWGAGLAQDTLNREIRHDTNAMISREMLPLTAFPLFNFKPSLTESNLTKTLAPYYLDWLAHPEYDDYWKQWAIDARYESIQVPALTIAAWYDIFQGGSLRNFIGLKAHAGNENARKQQRLLVTIGGHAGGGRLIGDTDFGPAATEYDENTITLDWYDYLFLGKQNSFASEKPVKIFVMGSNQWRYEDTWPLPRAKETRYLLHSDGKANTASGDGTLSTESAKTAPSDSYIYDPLNAVPTTGGPLCCDSEHLGPGPRDQRQVESRNDVLVYTTQPLDRDVEVTGQVSLDVFAKSSAVDTDFTGKLVDVAPDGSAHNLTEGILRARYRNSTSHAELIEPGKVYEYKIDLWSTSNVFLKGHRIRLEISSSNFPRFDRNLNTGKPASDNTDVVKATNTILHDSEHPSALVLPLVTQ
jgi:uncharacterized protein